NSGGYGVGFDAAVGAELSLVEGLNIGPFAKFMFLGKTAEETTPHMLLTFGLSLSIGAPQTTPAEADYDSDGVKGDADKCVDEAEDMDGFEDADGCPDKDDDKDGVEDVDDKCPKEKGEADFEGCAAPPVTAPTPTPPPADAPPADLKAPTPDATTTTPAPGVDATTPTTP
ncbi:MAG: hypothetical protein ACO1OB_23705, partial [Archangium sp.]